MEDMGNNTTQNGETNTTEPTGTNGKEPKSFTQEEVDRIVQDRLARGKKEISTARAGSIPGKRTGTCKT